MSFLNGNNLKQIWYPFYPRTTWHRSASGSVVRKAIIPIGVHELEIKKIVDSKSKKGWRKLELHMYKAPDYFRDDDSEKCSFDTIVCTHCPTYHPQGKLTSEWYKRWTMSLSNSDLDKMLTWEKKRFKAVIMHRQEHVQEVYDGVRKPKIGIQGEDVIYWQPIILSVHRLDEDVQIKNWFDLFRPIRYDPIEESKQTVFHEMLAKNYHMVTGKEKIDEDEIPF